MSEIILSIEELLNINYNILGYYKEKIYNKGEIIEIRYWENFVDNVYKNLKVKEIFNYFKNEINLTIGYNKIIEFYENDNVFATKNITKYFNNIEIFEHDYNKSLNMINEAKVYILNNFPYIEAKNILIDFNNSINLFINGNGDILRNEINNSTLFNETQKNKLLNILTY